MNILILNTKIENLDYRNIYMIKTMVNGLLSEFNEAINKNNFKYAVLMRSYLEKIHNKIKPNLLWSKKVNMALNDMDKKLNQ